MAEVSSQAFHPSGPDALDAGIAAARRGDLIAARQFAEVAIHWASMHGEQAFEDRAYCCRCALVLEREGLSGAEVDRLKRIALRYADSESGFLATYNLAAAYDKTSSWERAQFYARLAQHRAQLLERPDFLAWSHNALGNIYLRRAPDDLAFFDRARDFYESASGLLPEGDPFARAIILQNLAYCRLIEGSSAEGLELASIAFDSLERLGSALGRAESTLILSFAYKELGDWQRAWEYADIAFEHAARVGSDHLLRQARARQAQIIAARLKDIRYERDCGIEDTLGDEALLEAIEYGEADRAVSLLETALTWLGLDIPTFLQPAAMDGDLGPEDLPLLHRIRSLSASEKKELQALIGWLKGR